MARTRQVQNTAFPLERIEVFSPPTKDDYELVLAQKKAYKLLKSILPEKSWIEFGQNKFVEYHGQRGIYRIYSHWQTEIFDPKSSQKMANACLQLTVSAPAFDRVIAEYLLLKNDEDRYWKTANIFHVDLLEMWKISVFFLDIFLLLICLSRIFAVE